MLMTLAKACQIAAYDQKKLVDDRVILRREAGVDFITAPPAGKAALETDDVVALTLYADLRRAGHKVRLAGTIASRFRAAMRDHPRAHQLVMVTLENGNVFTLPVDILDLASGYNSGQFLATAFLVDVRNFRACVQRAIEAFDRGIEVADEAA